MHVCVNIIIYVNLIVKGVSFLDARRQSIIKHLIISFKISNDDFHPHAALDVLVEYTISSICKQPKKSTIHHPHIRSRIASIEPGSIRLYHTIIS